MRSPVWLVVSAVAMAVAAVAVEASSAASTPRSRAKPVRRPPLKLPHPCERSSCYPATGNLLIGRENKLTASSTCGLRSPEKYCIVSHLHQERTKCFLCDSRPHTVNDPSVNHRVSNIVYRYDPIARKRSWWQARNGVENVTLQLDLEAEFHFTHLIIVFKTFRPAAMFVERSFDFGKSWRVYRYFAHDCAESFPGVARQTPRNLTEVVCEEKYSNVAPSSEGEIIFRVLTPNIFVDNPYSQEVQNLLKMTNLRINFTKLHTLGDDLLDDTAEIREKYYYAISDMMVRGSCSCYGHASRCLPLPGVEAKEAMVHGRCECTHNTKGLNCETCEDFYNDIPWKPAIGKITNACQQCTCNNHATTCHFDSAVYELTAKVSGGVCDDCRHNTMGRNCELCKPYFYRDPELDVQHFDVCKPCDCDPRGSLDDAICDALTDVANGLDSGRCHCKTNVEGRRCDTCKNGFWNFDENDPDGCRSCMCNPLGTVDNRGCDVNTGECTCKRNVVGRDCNQCLSEHWGLGEGEDGCQRCDCDLGGSLDNNCDVVTGQCRCRPNVQGRQCDIPAQHFFSPALDYLLYEAEGADCSLDINSITSNCQLTVKESSHDGREDTWTGPGFMRVFEDDSLAFNIDDITTTADYDIIIRYAPQVQGDWERAIVTIERPEPITADSPCAAADPNDDIKEVTFPYYDRSVLVVPPVCLEEGKVYKLIIDFKRHRIAAPNTRASLLIDSIVLEPRITSLPFFKENTTIANVWRDNYLRAGCENVNSRNINNEISEECKQYQTSIGFFIFNGALSCNCDPEGSVSYKCEEYGGHCPCRTNVVGRRCNHCASGTYGFGPEGCKICECSSIGALDNFCDVGTGQCKCRPNTYGRQCDECQPGYWNFPSCQQCECHAHADTCDSKTGICTSCRDSTEGHRCEKCIEGYYGDPRLGHDIPCRACPCPGTKDSKHSFASQCILDRLTNDVICECYEGYAGPRCDVCADNYFGHPEEPGGVCEKCNCTKNIDISKPGNCHPHTGKCLQCLYNTGGDHCEVCQPGYYGDASLKTCQECNCEILGTNSSMGLCDRITGQCHCFGNVIGLECDQCAKNHWKLASGEGCVPCDCDQVGSTNAQCNVFDGTCNCKPEFGGRQCDQCETNHWGNPNVECFPCECDDEGSAQKQCRHDTGACICKPGIGGYKCDVCARGYYGDYCIACGECFDNWDLLISGLNNMTNNAINKASKIQTTGATGAYTKDFDEMEKKINKIQNIVNDTILGNNQINDFDEIIRNTKENFEVSKDKVVLLNSALVNTSSNINFANYFIESLRKNYEKLLNKTIELDNNATKLQEANLEGALNLTRDAKQKAMNAADDAEATQLINRDTERHIKGTEQLVERQYTTFNNTQNENDKNLMRLKDILRDLESQIPELNDKMCGHRGYPCGVCGGAGCGKCGGFSCERGAVTKATDALDYANKTNTKIQERDSDIEDILATLTTTKRNTTGALLSARETYNAVLAARNRTDDLTRNSNILTRNLTDFLSNSGNTPTDVRTLANHILNQTIDLKREEIVNLANEINQTASRVTNIDDIIGETKADLETAKQLKIEAVAAKEIASSKLKKANTIIQALDEAIRSQKLVEDAIKKANEDVTSGVKKLPLLENQLDETNKQSEKAAELIDGLTIRLNNLDVNIVKVEDKSKAVKDEVEKLVVKAEIAHQQARELRQKYIQANSSLVERTEQTANSRERAELLLHRASQLAVNTHDQLKKLQGMEDLYNNHTKKLADLENHIKNLNEQVREHLGRITERSEYYRVCN